MGGTERTRPGFSQSWQRGEASNLAADPFTQLPGRTRNTEFAKTERALCKPIAFGHQEPSPARRTMFATDRGWLLIPPVSQAPFAVAVQLLLLFRIERRSWLLTLLDRIPEPVHQAAA